MTSDLAMQHDNESTDGWQQRAVTAETKVEELQAQLGSASGALSEAQAALVRTMRQREIEVALLRADAIDLDATRLLLVEASSSQDAPLDAAKAALELKKQKPYLFRTGRSPSSGMGRSSGAQPGHGLSEIVEQARLTGDRRALLKYLRAKRNN